MADNNPQVILAPMDLADTGQWRLIIYLSRFGMRAFMKHLSDKSRQIIEILSTEWSSDDSSMLLKNIENAVYDHPGLLDDYATEIILETPQTCFAPNEITDEEEDAEQTIFESLFPGAEREVLSDRLNSSTALFSLARGLDGFITRTIPGARVRSHLAVIVDRFQRSNADGVRIYIDIRHNNEVDIIAFRANDLISACTQQWHSFEDIAFRIFNLLNAYHIDAAQARINLSGIPEERKKLRDFLRKYCGEVEQTTLPANSNTSGMPLAALLQAYRD